MELYHFFSSYNTLYVESLVYILFLSSLFFYLTFELHNKILSVTHSPLVIVLLNIIVSDGHIVFVVALKQFEDVANIHKAV